ncbi:amino acid permease-associated protein [Polycladomyces abyssicola]|uniref:Amino acid permease-associated protein n=1 Tax=Polycladomyces abyssicola TaxID=1125966 RepID=A0A8D5UFC6_9BACL|nr:APC family permease [Polycladomyces abyssicola]BCU81456.1 amino acid permease-associated protein [Polycladomyces abyssicola]
MNQSGQLKRSLNLWQIVVLGVGYMTPMVVFDTFGIVSGESGGLTPTAYIVGLIAMLFTAASYGQMVKAFPNAGSAYTYTQKTISPHLGFLVGWSALLDYIFLPMVNALLAKIYFNALFPTVPDWIWVLLFVAAVTVLNVLNVNFLANFNTFLVFYQTLVVVLYIALVIQDLLAGKGAGSVFTLQPLVKPDLDFSHLLAGASIVCFSYLGFDAVTTLSEETPEPTKTIPRGIFLVAMVGGLIFITTSYFAQAMFPDVSKFNDPEAPSPEMALIVGGKIFQIFFLAGAFMGTLASGLASHASVTRLLYAMGRDRVLPKKVFGYVHPRWGTPVYNVIIVGFVCLTALFIELDTAASLINYGALIAFTFVNLSVIAHYVVKEKQHSTLKGFFSYLISPLAGAAFVAYLWYSIQTSALVMGLIWSGVGITILMYITKMFRVQPPQYQEDNADQKTIAG